MSSFLQLTSDIQQPFIIPNLSPVSQPNSRKNSLNEPINKELLNKDNKQESVNDDAAADAITRPRTNSICLL
ncbi:hypothetical protein TPHA_0B01440 [Tetrapisispora phaffii CBS 4417]|uniref:Uncharacterized protein n=1 Tax=Tetrapisispora phaffii (strain ATCC 24235 / CBS 4417 / NBRC 1672 / NRRL Y-8282 / UCD 70-5) TaxID=1071381 RepID=G8BP86_TETPH|nr:hypothetical protein TPHA_0B01440 [Tetrapisispora phaffii CBS 4417]CCE61817.1 hypothetical protein TPHA_0B01440 [Tetrapisispora phaffii CBS 4417]